MVVIVVIAILAAISVVAYTNVQSRARVAVAQSELSNIRTKLLEHETFHGSLSDPNPQDHLEVWRSILEEARVDSSSRYTVCGSADGSYATIGNIGEFRWLWAGDAIHFVDTRGNMREVAYIYDESVGGAHQNQQCQAMLGEDYERGRSIPSPDLLVH